MWPSKSSRNPDFPKIAWDTRYRCTGLTPPNNWNNTDDPFLYPYNSSTSPSKVKPGLQAFFQNQFNLQYGQVENTDPNAWTIFLNYYFWMQNCVDTQVGNVITALQGQPALWNNTLVIFTSDHGDFGGSHNLRSKGGALYDECLNVPLFISFPEQRRNQTTPKLRHYVCSSVDILPFIYSMALGNEAWRCSTPLDLVGYLGGREFYTADGSAFQWREAPGIASASGGCNQPYILHTADTYPVAYVPNSPNGTGYGPTQPSHAIAFRTVDPTVSPNAGAKLGIYSYWGKCTTTPIPNPGSGQYPQYEFYNYSPTVNNYAEIGNDGVSSINATTGQTTSAAARRVSKWWA